MWTVVYLANSTELKNTVCSLLDRNGILNRVQTIASDGEDVDTCYNIFVPEAEVSAAHALILDLEL